MVAIVVDRQAISDVLALRAIRFQISRRDGPILVGCVGLVLVQHRQSRRFGVAGKVPALSRRGVDVGQKNGDELVRRPLEQPRAEAQNQGRGENRHVRGQVGPNELAVLILGRTVSGRLQPDNRNSRCTGAGPWNAAQACSPRALVQSAHGTGLADRRQSAGQAGFGFPFMSRAFMSSSLLSVSRWQTTWGRDPGPRPWPRRSLWRPLVPACGPPVRARVGAAGWR